MRAFKILLAQLVPLIIFVGLAGAKPTEGCALIVTENWPKGSSANSRNDARHNLYKQIGILLGAAYNNGDYNRDPKQFPIDHTDFRGDEIVFSFRTPCARARLYLGELLRAYRNRLTAKEKLVGPELVVGERPATKYERQCGVGANAHTCPLR